jgi:hypothetical protein
MIMALYVNSLNCKNFNEKDFNIGEADQIGFLMVGLGMGEVRKIILKRWYLDLLSYRKLLIIVLINLKQQTM